MADVGIMIVDNVDKKLVSILVKDGRTSLSEIGKQLGMSHVAVSKRLEKMQRHGLLQVTAAVNTEKLDVKMLFMAIETENSEVADMILEKYKDCPRLIMLTPVTGRYNLFAVMIAEDTWSLESIIGTCSLRTEPGVRRSETWFGNAPFVPKYLPIDLAPERDANDVTPCGRDCGSCKRYQADKCLGCPPTSHYKGTLWVSPRTAPKRQRKNKS